MRKIIDGKSYDTDTAELVGDFDNECSPTDLEWFQERLYRKRTGEYFVWGEGGAKTRYAVHRYGMWAMGEAITPLSYEEARQWAEDHLSVEDYEEEFGVPEEDDGLKVVASYRISTKARAAIQREAARAGVSLGEVVERLAATLGE